MITIIQEGIGNSRRILATVWESDSVGIIVIVNKDKERGGGRSKIASSVIYHINCSLYYCISLQIKVK